MINYLKREFLVLEIGLGNSWFWEFLVLEFLVLEINPGFGPTLLRKYYNLLLYLFSLINPDLQLPYKPFKMFDDKLFKHPTRSHVQVKPREEFHPVCY